MKYLVYFYSDAQVLLLDEDDVNLGEFNSLSVDEWRKFGEDEVVVKAIYEGDVYSACVLMVVLNEDDDCRELLQKLRVVITRKRLKAKSLIKYCGTRVKNEKTRLKVLPPNVSISFNDR